MIRCPVCQQEALPGTIFCPNCGTSFLENRKDAPGELSPGEPGSKEAADVHLALRLLAGDVLLQIQKKPEIIIGRSRPGQQLIPDVDLEAYGAHEMGVSRIHAMILWQKDQIQIVDLGSANGTCLNDLPLQSRTPYPVNNGDVLTIGNLKLEMLIQSKNPKDGP